MEEEEVKEEDEKYEHRAGKQRAIRTPRTWTHSRNEEKEREKERWIEKERKKWEYKVTK